VNGNNFWFGGSFSGSIQGAQGYGGQVGVYGQTGKAALLGNVLAGVFGNSDRGWGVFGFSIYAPAVEGRAPLSNGVAGTSERGAGVFGESNYEPGVFGFAGNSSGIKGVSAREHLSEGPTIPDGVTIAGVVGTS